MEDRRRYEEDERARRKEEAGEQARLEEERKIREQQFMVAQVRLVKMPIETLGGSKNPVGLGVKLAPLSEEDDIEAYLVTFERIMTIRRVDKG